MNKRLIRGLVMTLAILSLMALCPWGYTNLVVANARSKGEYASAEAGMLALISKNYAPDHTVKIYSARPDAHDGSNPYVWYVIAEVRASSRADGSDMGKNGCDAPGSFFLQTKKGWVHVSEGAFPIYVGKWMKVLDMAGEGQTTPSTDWAPGQSRRFCLE